MKSLTNEQKLNKNYINNQKIKKKIIDTQENNNYKDFSINNQKYSKKEEIPYEYNNYQKLYINKKNIFNNIKTDVVELENKYNKINDSFFDKQNDRDSLTLQIAGTESIKEIKYKKHKKKLVNNFISSPTKTKTPEKKIKDIKKNVKTRKYRQKKEKENKNVINNNIIIDRNYNQELNNYNNNNKNTATFNEDNKKKYNEFTFHKDENINNNNDNIENNNKTIDYNYDENRNGGKVDLFETQEKNALKDINNNDYNYNNLSTDIEHKGKILKLLKINKININKKRKKFLNISKSQDQLKLPKANKIYKANIKENKKEIKNIDDFSKTSNNFNNKGKLDKRLLKEIIYDNGKPIVFEKKISKESINNYEEEYSSIFLNHSFDAPITYKKKIIKRFKNMPFINKKKENKTISPLYPDDNRTDYNYINYTTKKSHDNIFHESIKLKLDYIRNNSSLTSMNKKLIFTDGNKNIISNYYNNNFYNTPIKNYVEQSSFYIGDSKRSRSLNNSIKKILYKGRNRNYNLTNKKDNCINISLNNSSVNFNEDSFFTNNNTIYSKYEINPNITYEYRSPKMNSKQNRFKNKHISINIEEFMILGEKLFDIIISLINNKKMTNQCFEFLNYFFNSTLPRQISNLFLNSELRNAVHSMNYILMSILISYDYSFDLILIDRCFSLLKETLELINNNYLILGKYIIKKVSKKNKENKWIFKLNNMLIKNKHYSNVNDINNNYINNNISSKEKIVYNTNIIIKNLNIFLEHFKSNSNESLLIFFKKITKKTFDDINYYYKTFLLREENINGSFLASLYLKDNPNFNSVSKPYIKKINNKKYTLVLDLEETLLNFKLKLENKGEGILKLRPGLFDFLDEVQKFYEIILFTASSQDYAESLIDSIEEKKKYFNYKFFRQHNIIVENDFVKDISRIGRDLDKIIIVDNMPQNYRLHKKNGIYIKGFWGEDLCDRVLFYLKTILVKIAKDGGDLRDGLIKYHEEISQKVSSSIYKFNFER